MKKSMKKPVKNDEKNEKKESLIDAAKSGNKKKTLIALRDKLAEKIETCESGRDLAALSKRLSEVMDELDEIKAAEKAKRDKRAAEKRKKEQESMRDQLRVINGG